MNIEEYKYEHIESAATALAEKLAISLRNGISLRGHASLAVSGGRTPRHVFERLRQQEIDWRKVTITLTDERWVAADHPDSNEKLVRTFLLQGAAAEATFIPLYTGDDSPRAGQLFCESRLADLPMPFDAVYLGMGDDGHFASLFPGDPAVDARDSRCVAVPAVGSRVARMSLTAPTILNAEKVFLLFSGAEKHAKYIAAQRPGSRGELPLRWLFSQNKTPLIVLRVP